MFQNLGRKPNAMLPSLPHTMMNETPPEERVCVREAAFMAATEEERQGKTLESGDPATAGMMGRASSSREGPVVLQWGQRKRPRCSRVDNHLKHSTITDEPAVLLRKTVRVKAEKVAAAEIKNGMRERPRLPPPMAEMHAGTEEGRKKAKISRGGADLPKLTRAAPLKEVKGAHSHAPLHSAQQKNSHLNYVDKTRTSPDRNTSSPCRSVIPNGGGIEIAAAKIELDWPKFLISLSRKEKEDDFYRIKGTKLPQRPKRRPKVVERALHFCTPGSWLSDLSRGRYDVREKKCVKKKPRGLKAMESMDSDSE